MKDEKIQFANTYSGGDPRKLNDVKTISTRWPGPAKNMYKHCREWFDTLFITGAANVPFCGPPGRDTKVWSHSAENKKTKIETAIKLELMVKY